MAAKGKRYASIILVFLLFYTYSVLLMMNLSCCQIREMFALSFTYLCLYRENRVNVVLSAKREKK